MILGPNIIVKCPLCGVRYQKKTLRSGNTFGAECFSDGECFANMLPQYPEYSKCHRNDGCGAFIKVIDCAIIGEAQKREEDAPFLCFSSADECLQIINEKHFTQQEDILQLRILLLPLDE